MYVMYIMVVIRESQEKHAKEKEGFSGAEELSGQSSPRLFTASLEQENPKTDFSFSLFLSVLLPSVTGVKEHRLVE